MQRPDWLKIGGVLCLAFFLLGSCGLSRQEKSYEEAERLLKSSDFDSSQALLVLAICENLLPQATSERTNLLTRLSQVCFLLGERSPKDQKQKYFEKGRLYAESLSREQPAWADGHYWLALNICGLAEIGGPRHGLRMLPNIIQELEYSLTIDETYDQAGAHRVLGRIYYEAPSWPLSVGDIHKSLRHLTAAVSIAPENSTNHLYLAETLFRLGKKAEACRELERVLNSTRHALWPQGLNHDRQEARRLLKEWAVSGPRHLHRDTPLAQAGYGANRD
ncbi:MAG: hypothetical protein AB1491_10500 [Thermodesulfobacteriota bacterium]